MILIVKHIDVEGPGTFGDFLTKRNIPFTIVDLGAGEKLPKDLSGIDAVCILGGPMNVYEEEKYPFLKEEDIFIKKVLKSEVPFFGICLGSQLLAKAAGAKVRKNEIKEIGWSSVELTSDGQRDRIFKDLPKTMPVYQWHEDTFEIPTNGVHLAEFKDCKNQAFRVGCCAYGLQFHIEITDKSIKDWTKSYLYKKDPTYQKQRDEMLQIYKQTASEYTRQAETVYENFLNLMKVRV